MPTTVRLELNVEGFNEYRNSETVVQAMEEIARGIQTRATSEVVFREYADEEPFTVNTRHNRTRAVTFVSTHSFDGELAEAVNRTLSRAIP